MFILTNKTNLTNAIEKAKAVRPRVKFVAFGRYLVSGSKGNFYQVVCKKTQGQHKVVDCECKGAERGLVCYHSAAALAVHTGLARQRQTAA